MSEDVIYQATETQIIIDICYRFFALWAWLLSTKAPEQIWWQGRHTAVSEITHRTFKELTLLQVFFICTAVVFMFALCDLAARPLGGRAPSFGHAEASQACWNSQLPICNFNQEHVLRAKEASLSKEKGRNCFSVSKRSPRLITAELPSLICASRSVFTN